MKDTADVCMILEGTYPYVSGGVSSWVHSLIQGLPDITFTLMFVGADRESRAEMQYELPPNVVGLDEFYILDQGAGALDMGGRGKSLKAGLAEMIDELHRDLKHERTSDTFATLAAALSPDARDGPSIDRLIRSRRSWRLLLDLYDQYGSDSSFIDYYWTFVFTHLPIFRVLFAEPPPARVYHTISTGYGGFMAALAKERTGSSMLVTEHGIYTHERELEIAQATWIYAADHDALQVSRTKSFFKQWWIDMFRYFSNATYSRADAVITITGVNQPYQRHDGADPERMRVIPNGIDIERFSSARRDEVRSDGSPFTVGFVGRVVPIKDVKTLLRGIKVCHEEVPEMRCIIVGPYDEDRDYYDECLQLSANLGRADVVEFTGKANVLDYYPQMDVLVLTSASEAVPLVILEASCAGIPVVATDVGACKEMLLGRTGADQALGPSGIITPVASPEITGKSLVRLAQDSALGTAMGRSGIARVERFYRLETVHYQYDRLYREMGALGREPVGATEEQD
ncbi:MAG: GT4 family glycosyltransferase PelF [Chloroflexi bacterium]|nr:GT4 family glycosyltransferase PelF [Chloroflexota bacterium]